MQKKYNTSLQRMYLSEVLGVSHYLCPEDIYSLRSLKGPLPCSVLIVLFQTSSPSQKKLLKKIMRSINIFEYSLLEIKNDAVLSLLFSKKWADFICFFGGKDLIKQGFLVKKNNQLLLANQNRIEAKSKKSTSFLQVCALEELEGVGTEVNKNKHKTWTLLKQWRQNFFQKTILY